MITISDMHGSRQYTLHQLIRHIALWAVLAIVAIIGIGAFFLNVLSTEVDDLDTLTQKLESSKQELGVENQKLELMQSVLSQKIKNKTHELESMDEQLSEIEKIVGLEPDISSAFDSRVETAKQKSLNNVHQAQLSIAELSLLNRSIPTGFPVKNYRKITDKFGYRMHPIKHKRVFHFGLDFSAKIGTPIYAPADGVVSFAKTKSGYGKFLLVDHPFGFKTAYGHLSKFAVSEGTYVSKGDIIAYVGNTGRSTGAHLHYEVRYLHKWLNPMSFVKWSSKTYKKTMNQERLVNWKMLFDQLRTRYQLKTTISASL